MAILWEAVQILYKVHFKHRTFIPATTFLFFWKIIFGKIKIKIIIVLTLRRSAMHCSVFNFCHVNLLLFERDEMGVSHAFRVDYGRNFKILSKNYLAFLILDKWNRIRWANKNHFVDGIGEKMYLDENLIYWK